MLKVIVVISIICSSLFTTLVHSIELGLNGETLNEITIVNHGWHTGIIVPAKPIQSIMPSLKSRFKHSRFIEFGWGDKGFYQAKEITIPIAIKALLWPTESVMHTVGFTKKPEHYFKSSEQKKLCLTDNALAKLNQFIKQSFLTNTNNQVIVQRKGIYGNSQFYQGVGSYHAFNTCNKWTAIALNKAGVSMNPSFKLTAQSVMSELHNQSSCSSE